MKSAVWEIGWDGAERPISGSEPTLPEARVAAQNAVADIDGVWQRPGIYVRITGSSGGVWYLRPTPKKPGEVSWSRTLNPAGTPNPVREVEGINLPNLLRALSKKRQGSRHDPVCLAAAIVIKHYRAAAERGTAA